MLPRDPAAADQRGHDAPGDETGPPPGGRDADADAYDPLPVDETLAAPSGAPRDLAAPREPTDERLGDRGPDDLSPDDRSSDDRGPDDRGPDDLSPEERGPDSSGPDSSGPDSSGPDAVAMPAAAPDDDLLAGGDADRFRHRWRELQAGFVDDPRRAVKSAGELVEEVIRTLGGLLTEQRQALATADDSATEQLRQAFRRHRAVFDRLVGS